MIIGIGIDLCDVARMTPMLQNTRFLKKYFTSDEQAYILGKKAVAAQTLAGHFAAKEAGLKALRCGIAFPLTEIEVKHDALGAPSYNLSGGVRKRMEAMHGKFMRLTITHTDQTAAAVAVLEGEHITHIEAQEHKEALLHRMIDGRYPYTLITESDINEILPERPFDAHKGSCGHAMIVAGSFGMAGAASLCVNAALRGGAGLVTAVCPKEIIPIIQILAPCAMCVPTEELRHSLPTKSAVAAGPGLGKCGAVTEMLQTLLAEPLPQVWDADALNWLSDHPQALSSHFVLTPHYGEAARLLRVSIQKIQENPADAAFQLHKQYGAVILLKGPVTLVTDGVYLACNITGTPGMATGGSGDVLTGLIAAFLAQNLSPYNAARAAAFLHGTAGEAAAASTGVRSMTAQDILNALGID